MAYGDAISSASAEDFTISARRFWEFEELVQSSPSHDHESVDSARPKR